MGTTPSIKQLLISLGLSTEESIVPYYPRVRDRDDVSVLKCTRSGVIFLSRSDHMDIAHYNAKVFNGRGAQDRQDALRATQADTDRRAEQFLHLIARKRWIDIGTGAGGILDALRSLASEVAAVEPQDRSREALTKGGYTAYASIDEVPQNKFEVATLFHVLEHFIDPIGTLRAAKERLLPGGKIIVEVPHADDFLISIQNQAFQSHTFWSEHLMLHTRESLRVFLETAGFANVVVNGFQRYPVANHLYWLSEGKPGGHDVWSHLRTAELDHAYSAMLDGIDKTDTLIAIAEKPLD